MLVQLRAEPEEAVQDHYRRPGDAELVVSELERHHRATRSKNAATAALAASGLS